MLCEDQLKPTQHIDNTLTKLFLRVLIGILAVSRNLKDKQRKNFKSTWDIRAGDIGNIRAALSYAVN